jgi:hypothetical protein
MHLSDLQPEVNRRWDLQQDNPCHTSTGPEHAHLHMSKALGKVAAALNDSLHEGRPMKKEEVAPFLADLVLCAARFAGTDIDLDAAVVARLAEKFPVSG